MEKHLRKYFYFPENCKHTHFFLKKVCRNGENHGNSMIFTKNENQLKCKVQSGKSKLKGTETGNLKVQTEN